MRTSRADRRPLRAGTVLLGLALLGVAVALDARQFRQIVAIPTPGPGVALPPGAKPVAAVTAVPRAEVERALGTVVAAWNSQALDDRLAAGFYDRTRLLDTLDGVAPRDATLRLQSIQGVQTLAQFVQPAADGRDSRIVSRVSVTARTQVEFRGADGSFVRRDGVNEFVLKLTHGTAGP